MVGITERTTTGMLLMQTGNKIYNSFCCPVISTMITDSE
uniref:Uncharacterized protein n=1 Tax=Setaria italica TaxID=4555 RepID=K3Z1C5_SETIT